MKALKVIYTGVKLITVAICIFCIMNLVSCKSEPVQPVLSSNGVETITTETIEVETIEEETIESEMVSDEYRAELEFNSRPNRW